MRVFRYHKAFAASLIVAVAAFALVSCDGISSGNGEPAGSYDEPLEITGVRYQDADSVDEDGNPLRPDTIRPGDRIALEGQNMNSVASVSFFGYEANHNTALASEEHLVVGIPNNLPFGELDVAALDSLDKIRVENEASEASYNEIPVLPPPPAPQTMSDEYADPGEEVTVTGSFLYLVESATLPDGTTIPGEKIETTTDGSEAVFSIPDEASEEDGPLVYETSSGLGESTPSFEYRDRRGMLLNLDSHTDWSGWSAMASSDAESDLRSDFESGADGTYLIMKGDGAIAAGDSEWWTGNRIIELAEQEWISPENLDESLENFALKFELNVRQEWEAGQIQIYLLETASSDSYGTGYGFRLKPWEQEDGSVSSVQWQGWQTITLPFSEFTDSAGSKDGSAAPDLTTLFGEDGTVGSGGPDDNPTAFRLLNGSDRDVPAEQAFAIDNIRVVRIAE